MIQSGELRYRLEVHRNESSTQDACGAPIDNWLTYSRPWCKIEPVSGQEMLVAKSYAATVTHKITTRVNPTKPIRPTDRLVWGSRIFAINSVIDIEESGQELNLYVTELQE